MLNCNHRDDLAEIGTEAPQHAGLVHVTQHRFRPVSGGEDFHEQPIGFHVLLERAVHALQGFGDQPQRVGMKREVMDARRVKNADQIDGIALEHRIVGHVQPAILHHEVARAFQLLSARAEAYPAHEAVQPRRVLGFRFSSSAQTIRVRSPTSFATRK
jgi:hypothetical protein